MAELEEVWQELKSNPKKLGSKHIDEKKKRNISKKIVDSPKYGAIASEIKELPEFKNRLEQLIITLYLKKESDWGIEINKFFTDVSNLELVWRDLNELLRQLSQQTVTLEGHQSAIESALQKVLLLLLRMPKVYINPELLGRFNTELRRVATGSSTDTHQKLLIRCEFIILCNNLRAQKNANEWQENLQQLAKLVCNEKVIDSLNTEELGLLDGLGAETLKALMEQVSAQHPARNWLRFCLAANYAATRQLEKAQGYLEVFDLNLVDEKFYSDSRLLALYELFKWMERQSANSSISLDNLWKVEKFSKKFFSLLSSGSEDDYAFYYALVSHYGTGDDKFYAELLLIRRYIKTAYTTDIGIFLLERARRLVRALPVDKLENGLIHFTLPELKSLWNGEEPFAIDFFVDQILALLFSPNQLVSKLQEIFTQKLSSLAKSYGEEKVNAWKQRIEELDKSVNLVVDIETIKEELEKLYELRYDAELGPAHKAIVAHLADHLNDVSKVIRLADSCSEWRDKNKQSEEYQRVVEKNQKKAIPVDNLITITLSDGKLYRVDIKKLRDEVESAQNFLDEFSGSEVFPQADKRVAMLIALTKVYESLEDYCIIHLHAKTSNVWVSYQQQPEVKSKAPGLFVKLGRVVPQLIQRVDALMKDEDVRGCLENHRQERIEGVRVDSTIQGKLDSLTTDKHEIVYTIDQIVNQLTATRQSGLLEFMKNIAESTAKNRQLNTNLQEKTSYVLNWLNANVCALSGRGPEAVSYISSALSSNPPANFNCNAFLKQLPWNNAALSTIMQSAFQSGMAVQCLQFILNNEVFLSFRTQVISEIFKHLYDTEQGLDCFKLLFENPQLVEALNPKDIVTLVCNLLMVDHDNISYQRKCEVVKLLFSSDKIVGYISSALQENPEQVTHLKQAIPLLADIPDRPKVVTKQSHEEQKEQSNQTDTENGQNQNNLLKQEVNSDNTITMGVVKEPQQNKTTAFGGLLLMGLLSRFGAIEVKTQSVAQKQDYLLLSETVYGALKQVTFKDRSKVTLTLADYLIYKLDYFVTAQQPTVEESATYKNFILGIYIAAVKQVSFNDYIILLQNAFNNGKNLIEKITAIEAFSYENAKNEEDHGANVIRFFSGINLSKEFLESINDETVMAEYPEEIQIVKDLITKVERLVKDRPNDVARVLEETSKAKKSQKTADSLVKLVEWKGLQGKTIVDNNFVNHTNLILARYYLGIQGCASLGITYLLRVSPEKVNKLTWSMDAIGRMLRHAKDEDGNKIWNDYFRKYMKPKLNASDLTRLFKQHLLPVFSNQNMSTMTSEATLKTRAAIASVIFSDEDGGMFRQVIDGTVFIKLAEGYICAKWDKPEEREDIEKLFTNPYFQNQLAVNFYLFISLFFSPSIGNLSQQASSIRENFSHVGEYIAGLLPNLLKQECFGNRTLIGVLKKPKLQASSQALKVRVSCIEEILSRYSKGKFPVQDLIQVVKEQLAAISIRYTSIAPNVRDMQNKLDKMRQDERETQKELKEVKEKRDELRRLEGSKEESKVDNNILRDLLQRGVALSSTLNGFKKEIQRLETEIVRNLDLSSEGIRTKELCLIGNALIDIFVNKEIKESTKSELTENYLQQLTRQKIYNLAILPQELTRYQKLFENSKPVDSLECFTRNLLEDFVAEPALLRWCTSIGLPTILTVASTSANTDPKIKRGLDYLWQAGFIEQLSKDQIITLSIESREQLVTVLSESELQSALARLDVNEIFARYLRWVENKAKVAQVIIKIISNNDDEFKKLDTQKIKELLIYGDPKAKLQLLEIVCAKYQFGTAEQAAYIPGYSEGRGRSYATELLTAASLEGAQLVDLLQKLQKMPGQELMFLSMLKAVIFNSIWFESILTSGRCTRDLLLEVNSSIGPEGLVELLTKISLPALESYLLLSQDNDIEQLIGTLINTPRVEEVLRLIDRVNNIPNGKVRIADKVVDHLANAPARIGYFEENQLEKLFQSVNDDAKIKLFKLILSVPNIRVNGQLIERFLNAASLPDELFKSLVDEVVEGQYVNSKAFMVAVTNNGKQYYEIILRKSADKAKNLRQALIIKVNSLLEKDQIVNSILKLGENKWIYFSALAESELNGLIKTFSAKDICRILEESMLGQEKRVTAIFVKAILENSVITSTIKDLQYEDCQQLLLLQSYATEEARLTVLESLFNYAVHDIKQRKNLISLLNFKDFIEALGKRSPNQLNKSPLLLVFVDILKEDATLARFSGKYMSRDLLMGVIRKLNSGELKQFLLSVYQDDPQEQYTPYKEARLNTLLQPDGFTELAKRLGGINENYIALIAVNKREFQGQLIAAMARLIDADQNYAITIKQLPASGLIDLVKSFPNENAMVTLGFQALVVHEAFKESDNREQLLKYLPGETIAKILERLSLTSPPLCDELYKLICSKIEFSKKTIPALGVVVNDATPDKFIRLVAQEPEAMSKVKEPSGEESRRLIKFMREHPQDVPGWVEQYRSQIESANKGLQQPLSELEALFTEKNQTDNNGTAEQNYDVNFCIKKLIAWNNVLVHIRSGVSLRHILPVDIKSTYKGKVEEILENFKTIDSSASDPVKWVEQQIKNFNPRIEDETDYIIYQILYTLFVNLKLESEKNTGSPWRVTSFIKSNVESISLKIGNFIAYIMQSTIPEIRSANDLIRFFDENEKELGALVQAVWNARQLSDSLFAKSLKITWKTRLDNFAILHALHKQQFEAQKQIMRLGFVALADPAVFNALSLKQRDELTRSLKLESMLVVISTLNQCKNPSLISFIQVVFDNIRRESSEKRIAVETSEDLTKLMDYISGSEDVFKALAIAYVNDEFDPGIDKSRVWLAKKALDYLLEGLSRSSDPVLLGINNFAASCDRLVKTLALSEASFRESFRRVIDFESPEGEGVKGVKINCRILLRNIGNNMQAIMKLDVEDFRQLLRKLETLEPDESNRITDRKKVLEGLCKILKAILTQNPRERGWEGKTQHILTLLGNYGYKELFDADLIELLVKTNIRIENDAVRGFILGNIELKTHLRYVLTHYSTSTELRPYIEKLKNSGNPELAKFLLLQMLGDVTHAPVLLIDRPKLNEVCKNLGLSFTDFRGILIKADSALKTNEEEIKRKQETKKRVQDVLLNSSISPQEKKEQNDQMRDLDAGLQLLGKQKEALTGQRELYERAFLFSICSENITIPDLLKPEERQDKVAQGSFLCKELGTLFRHHREEFVASISEIKSLYWTGLFGSVKAHLILEKVLQEVESDAKAALETALKQYFGSLSEESKKTILFDLMANWKTETASGSYERPEQRLDAIKAVLGFLLNANCIRVEWLVIALESAKANNQYTEQHETIGLQLLHIDRIDPSLQRRLLKVVALEKQQLDSHTESYTFRPGIMSDGDVVTKLCTRENIPYLQGAVVPSGNLSKETAEKEFLKQYLVIPALFAELKRKNILPDVIKWAAERGLTAKEVNEGIYRQPGEVNNTVLDFLQGYKPLPIPIQRVGGTAQNATILGEQHSHYQEEKQALSTVIGYYFAKFQPEADTNENQEVEIGEESSAKTRVLQVFEQHVEATVSQGPESSNLGSINTESVARNGDGNAQQELPQLRVQPRPQSQSGGIFSGFVKGFINFFGFGREKQPSESHPSLPQSSSPLAQPVQQRAVDPRIQRDDRNREFQRKQAVLDNIPAGMVKAFKNPPHEDDKAWPLSFCLGDYLTHDCNHCPTQDINKSLAVAIASAVVNDTTAALSIMARIYTHASLDEKEKFIVVYKSIVTNQGDQSVKRGFNHLEEQYQTEVLARQQQEQQVQQKKRNKLGYYWDKMTSALKGGWDRFARWITSEPPEEDKKRIRDEFFAGVIQQEQAMKTNSSINTQSNSRVSTSQQPKQQEYILFPTLFGCNPHLALSRSAMSHVVQHQKQKASSAKSKPQVPTTIPVSETAAIQPAPLQQEPQVSTTISPSETAVVQQETKHTKESLPELMDTKWFGTPKRPKKNVVG